MDEAAQEGRYQITANDDGVYLSVWPPVKDGEPVERASIVQELTERGYGEFDGRFISRVIRDALGTPVKVIHWLPRTGGRYQLTANDTGIYLSVWPPAGDGMPVSKATVVKDLAERGYNGFDEPFIAAVIKEAVGLPVLVVNAPPPVHPNIHVKISLDRMEARLSVSVPEGAAPVTMLVLLKALKAAGVVCGIDKKALKKLVQTKRLSANVVCASGTQPCHGQDALLHFKIEPERRYSTAIIGEITGGSETDVEWCSVQAGQLLVEKIPATPGTPGFDVFGFPIPAKPGKDIGMPIGQYVVNLDGRHLYAAISGQLRFCSDKRIDIIPTGKRSRKEFPEI